MSEDSYPWSGTVTGDAGPYSYTQWIDAWAAFNKAGGAGSRSADYNIGVLWGVGNNLYPEINGTNIDVETGAALVDGLYYESTAEESVAIPAPASAGRTDYIVIRNDYTAQTARLTRIAGVEGGGTPSLTQDTTRATYWDVPICTVDVALGGALSNLTDKREFAINNGVGTIDNTSVSSTLQLIVSVDGDVGDDEVGTSIDMYLESDAGTLRKAASFQGILIDSTDGAEESRIVMTTLSNGNERIRAVFSTNNDSSVNGNTRGSGATDLQSTRTNATEVASGNYSVVSGGRDNTASGADSFVGGGNDNVASNTNAIVVGGDGNTASNSLSSVVGGNGNTASGDGSFVGCGASNTASGIDSVIPGGNGNEASGTGSFAVGSSCTSSGEYSNALGNNCTANGDYSISIGRRAIGGGFDGVFIWGDSTNADFTADRANQFKIRCLGGAYFISDTASVAGLEIEQDADAPVLELDQDDDDSPFIEYDGTSAADQTKNISTANGDGATQEIKDYSTTAGWTFEGMLRISINGTDRWMPFYSADTS